MKKMLLGGLIFFGGPMQGIEEKRAVALEAFFEQLQKEHHNQNSARPVNGKSEKQLTRREHIKHFAQRFAVLACFVVLEHFLLRPILEEYFPSKERLMAEKFRADLEKLRADYEELQRVHEKLDEIGIDKIKRLQSFGKK